MQKVRIKVSKRFISIVTAVTMLVTSMPMIVSAANDLNGHWAKESIEKWIGKGLVSGYNDGSFKPESPITRAEFVRLVNRCFELITAEDVEFNDVSENDWYYNDVSIAIGEKYISGYGEGDFGPNDNLSRSQAAVIIQKIKGLEASGSNSDVFNDLNNIPEWAVDAVKAVTEKEYLSGYPDGSFKGNKSLTRAEAVSVLDRVIGEKAEINNVNEAINSNDIIIDNTNITVSSKVIEGDLIISENVGEGSVNIENTTIKGKVLIQGGGSNSIHMKNTVAEGGVYMNKNNVRLEVEGDTKVNSIVFQKPGKIDVKNFTGSIHDIIIDESIVKTDTITINAPADKLDIGGSSNINVKANILNVNVNKNAQGTKINISNNAKVTTLKADAKIDITGSGKITTLEANANGITSQIKAEKTNVSKNVESPKVISSGSSGGGSGSSSGSNTENKDKLSLIDFKLLSPSTISIKMDKTEKDMTFVIKDKDSGEIMDIEGTRMENDDYYYIYLAYNPTTTEKGRFKEDGSYEVTVSCSGYSSVTHNFKGSDMLKYFYINSVKSVTTDMKRNKLVIKLYEEVNDVSFAVKLGEENIAQSAVQDQNDKSIYTVNLNKIIEGGKTYNVIADAKGYAQSYFDYVAVESVTITNKKDVKTLVCGKDTYDSLILEIEILPANATETKYRCEIENEDIVTYHKNGSAVDHFILLSGETVGNTMVKVVSEDGGIFDGVEVETRIQLVEGFKFEKEILELRVGNTDDVGLNVEPWLVSLKDVEWSSSDESVVAITPKDSISYDTAVSVTGLKTGKATITATAKDEGKAQASFNVVVFDAKLRFEDETITDTIYTTQTSLKIILDIDPEVELSTHQGSFRWSTLSSKIVNIDSWDGVNSCTISPIQSVIFDGVIEIEFKGRLYSTGEDVNASIKFKVKKQR